MYNLPTGRPHFHERWWRWQPAWRIGTKITPNAVPIAGASPVGALWCGMDQRLKPHGALTAETRFYTSGRRQQPTWVFAVELARLAPHRLTGESRYPWLGVAEGTFDMYNLQPKDNAPLSSPRTAMVGPQ